MKKDKNEYIEKSQILIVLVLTVLCGITLISCKNNEVVPNENNLEVNTSEAVINTTNENDIRTSPTPDTVPDVTSTEMIYEAVTTGSEEMDILVINDQLKGGSVNLNINLEVEKHEGEQHGIYDASPICVDVDECLKFIFPNAKKEELYHEYDQSSYRQYFNVTDMDYRDKILNFRDNSTYEFIVYDPNKILFPFQYENGSEDIFIPIGGIGHLLRIQQEYLSPNEELLNESIRISEEFLTKIFKDEFTENFKLTYSGLKKMNPNDDSDDALKVYLNVFQRQIENLPILFDVRDISTDYYQEPIADELEAWVDNGTLKLSMGAIRHIDLYEIKDTISAENALEVLKANFEKVGATGTFDITRFELMYYATFTDDADTTNIYARCYGGGYVKYVPVWVIASGERLGGRKGTTTNEYVAIIDAVTGELIERRRT